MPFTELPEQHATHQDAWLLRGATTHALGALVLILWDTLIAFDEEVRYIWRKPNSSSIKWLFLYMRYVEILGAAASLVLSTQLPLSVDECIFYYVAQAMLLQSLVTSIELILVLRVYALYSRNLNVALSLTFVILTEIGITATTLRFMVPEIVIMSACIPSIPGKFLGYYLGGALSTQLAILTLTLHKYPLGSFHDWARVPLSFVAVRDGALAFGFVLGLLLGVAALMILQDALMYTAILYYWLGPLLSVIGCRLVLNMQSVPLTHDQSSDARLTSVNSILSSA